MQVPDSDRFHYFFMTAADTELFLDLDQDPEVMRYINGGIVSTPETIETWYIPRLAAYADQDKGWGLWGVREKVTQNFVGWILVRPMGFFGGDRDDENLELGWRFKRESWGKGYATEAARSVMRALEEIGYRRFSAIAMPENAASINIMQKLGMEFEREGLDPESKNEGDEQPIVYYTRSIAVT